MAAATVHSMEYGSRSSTGDWAPFAWTEPVRGPQIYGEVLVIRTGGTSGSLSAGLWRSGKGLAGCKDDGASRVYYSAPLGDETVVILEGTVEITVTSSGKKYQLQAGSTMSHPKNLDTVWNITSLFLKKFWVIFDSPKQATKSDDLFVGDISDNPAI